MTNDNNRQAKFEWGAERLEEAAKLYKDLRYVAGLRLETASDRLDLAMGRRMWKDFRETLPELAWAKLYGTDEARHQQEDKLDRIVNSFAEGVRPDMWVRADVEIDAEISRLRHGEHIHEPERCRDVEVYEHEAEDHER